MADHMPDLRPDQWRAVNEAASWDDRKTLADIWQDHSPLPADGLCEATYDALVAVARWGAAMVAAESEPELPYLRNSDTPGQQRARLWAANAEADRYRGGYKGRRRG
jgi:hypothetical protein